MTTRLQALRGMPDILPAQADAWATLEALWRSMIHRYGYQEIRLPLLESTKLFQRSIGDLTDIIEKEMFSLETADGESISLRPEGTASCVRAGLEHGLFYHQIQRLWYMGPMFRYERPQKGRYRQFHQIGVETFGIEGPAIELEHILMTQRLWRALGIDTALSLEVNSLGSFEARQAYRDRLQQYFTQHQQDLDADSQRRLQANPLRILDSKNPAMAALISDAPKGVDYLDAASVQHFESFLAGLSDLGIAYTVNPRLVRGLDYYNRTVYEWKTDQLGAQSAVGGGGRYDGLVEQLGGSATTAVGFSLGMERILLLQQAVVAAIPGVSPVDCYIVHTPSLIQNALALAERLRDAGGLRILVDNGPGTFKQQFKKADQSGARIALILGEAEQQADSCRVKFLREARDQISVPFQTLATFLSDYLGN
ncbi:MAG: histidine--tRNA ligase [Gammaproteobacteria bacterium]|nr:histidine--tRNA ligase [Gammaproteobacteria bacterium]MBP9729548.1 histidine--tRNA ligase [Gammaproteobacteria bacterium]